MEKPISPIDFEIPQDDDLPVIVGQQADGILNPLRLFTLLQNQFGIGGKYHNVGLTPGASRRVALAYDGRGHGTLSCNGQTLMTIDLPKAAIVEPVFYVSGDESGEDGELDVMQVIIFDQALSPAQMAALGGCGK